MLSRLTGYFVAAFLATAFIGNWASAAELRIALVIGNGGYETAPLNNPVNDARLMAATLRGVGFEVIERIDADQKAMKRAIQEFGERLEQAGQDGVGLFYFSGHGVQVGGVNYLIPIDTSINRESDVDIEAVSANAVLGTMEFARNRLNIVILDACRNNPYARSFRSAARGLARMDAPRGTLVAYATAPGGVAFDGEGANSPYTSALAQAMQAPGLKVEEAFKQVRLSVMAETGEQQVPWEASSLTGDFYFSPGSGAGTEAQVAVTPPTAATVASQVAVEVAFWQSIENSQDPADFEVYLEGYGQTGAFTVLARNRIRALAEQEAPGSAAVGQPPKSEEALVAEALIKARQMVVELKENAESLMESQDIPLGERLEKFRGMLGVVIDFEPMARFVLRRHKDTITPEQWEDFFLLYRELFLTGYSFSGAKSWAGKYEVKFIRAYGPDTLVTVEFTDERGKIAEVQFRLRRYLESFFGFKIIDAMTKGVSLLVTQRDDFAPILEREGVDGLIRALEEKVGKIEKPIEIPG